MPTMHDAAVKIRRGRRTDLAALLALLDSADPAVADKTQARHWRRLAGDPSLDFYVAEHQGVIIGALLVCYVRTLRQQGWQALLDIALRPCSSAGLQHELLEFAKARARQRGCRQLLVCCGRAEEKDTHALLIKGGFRPCGEVLFCDLS